MSKLREAIKEARHTVNVCMLFWRKYTEWRDAHRDHTAVFIHVGDPDIVQALIKRSPRWQMFEEFEKQHAAEMQRDALFARQSPRFETQAARDAARDVTAAVHRIAPLLRSAECTCPACTDSKATRSFDA